MIPLIRSHLAHAANHQQVPVEVVEKDYFLSYLLAGIADVSELRGLRFKGGTALKKMYFGDYRFSEDLDFSAVNAPHDAEMDQTMQRAIKAVEKRLAERGRFTLEFDRPPEREQHPTGQDAFRVRVAFPWQREPMVRVKVEITHDEPVLLPARDRPILHGYRDLGEEMNDVCVTTYALEEIVVEKLRALRQLQQKLDDRGWSRPRARDYYDLWRILSDYADSLDIPSVHRVLPEKFAHRHVTYEHVDDFFTPQLIADAEKHWETNLGTFVPILPSVSQVIGELHPLVERLLSLDDDSRK